MPSRISIGHALHGKYRLVRLLGDGGMGAVYEATHERLGTRVAIKILHGEIALRPGIVERFLQEARVSAQIRSPHVAQVMDVDRTPEGDAYMVMELLEGETLLALLERERKLSVGVACAFTLQILEALEAAHALNVVHRDLKPENVFVTHGTQKTTVKLIDFGIAKVRRDDSAVNLTMAGVTMGTAEYMAPEQAFSADQADARSDLYAVGVMLYEMLSGTRPVMGDDPRIIAMKVERGEIKPLVHALPSVPPPIAGFAHRAMASRPDMRFQSAAEMRLGLEKLVGHDAGGTLPLALAPARRISRDSPVPEAPRTAATGTLRGTPVGDHHHISPAAMSPHDVLVASDPPPPPKSTSAIPLIAFAILLGVGAVVALALAQGPRASTTLGTPSASSSSSTPAMGSLAVVNPASASAMAEEHPSALPSLTKTHTNPPATTTKVTPKSDAGTARPNPSASSTAPPQNTTGLPFPFPSTLPTDLPLPGFGP